MVTDWSNQLCSDLRDNLRKGWPASYMSSLPHPSRRATLCPSVSSWHLHVPDCEEEAAALSWPGRLAEEETIYLSEQQKHRDSPLESAPASTKGSEEHRSAG